MSAVTSSKSSRGERDGAREYLPAIGEPAIGRSVSDSFDVEAHIAEDATAYSELTSAFDGLPPERRVEPGVIGDWSIKDALVHVAAWQGMAAQAVERVCRGEPPWGSDDPAEWAGADAYNAEVVAEHAGDSWDDVAAWLRRARERCERAARLAASTLPPERLAPDRTAATMLRGNGHEHFREHAEQIRTWRQEQGL